MKVSNVSSVGVCNASVDNHNINHFEGKNIQSNTKNVSQTQLVDKNYGILQTKPMNVSFKGAMPSVPAKTVGQKVNNLFTIMRSNDMIVAAPNYKSAIDSFLKADKLNPKNTDIQRELARSYHMDSQYSKAVTYYDKLLSQDKDNKDHLIELHGLCAEKIFKSLAAVLAPAKDRGKCEEQDGDRDKSSTRLSVYG